MKRGFSLLELLFVLIIIGLILGVAVPNMMRAIDRERERQTKANAEALRSAIHQFFLQHEHYPNKLDGTPEGDPFLGAYFPVDPKTERLPPADRRPNAYTLTRRGISLGNNPEDLNKVEYGKGPPTQNVGGWLYSNETGKLWVNITANDLSGIPYSTY
jgi:general secretion pathway protein G